MINEKGQQIVYFHLEFDEKYRVGVKPNFLVPLHKTSRNLLNTAHLIRKNKVKTLNLIGCSLSNGARGKGHACLH